MLLPLYGAEAQHKMEEYHSKFWLEAMDIRVVDNTY